MKKLLVTIKYEKRWKLQIGEIEHIVDLIEINCKSKTTDDKIVCVPKNVSFSTRMGKIKATLK